MDADESPKPDDERESEPPPGIELPGADPAELGAMLRRAAASGLPQVSTASHTVEGGDLGSEILAILGAQGVGGAAGAHEVDRDELRDLYARVREALRRHGIDPDAEAP